MAQKLQIEGMEIDEVYDNIVKAGISKSDAGILVGDWLVAFHGASQRVFDYKTAFPATDSDCAPGFVRSFHHTDWVDGESVVQAGQTVGEDGFNLRLHQIEADLDSLGDDVRTTFQCMAEMRAALAQLLAELKSEINRLNADVFRLGAQEETGPTVSAKPFGGGRFIGTATVADRKMLLWDTAQGMLMLPGSVLPMPGEGGITDLRTNRAVAFAKLLASDPEIGRAVARGMNVKQIQETFGERSLPGQPPLSELIAILPAETRFTDVQKLQDAVTEREAAAARTSGMTDAVLAANFSVLGEVPSDVGNVRLEATVTIPEQTRVGLVVGGFRTVGDLAGATPSQVKEALSQQGVTVDDATAAGLVTQAKVLVMIH
jgi:hypothetical protein